MNEHGLIRQMIADISAQLDKAFNNTERQMMRQQIRVLESTQKFEVGIK